MNSFLQNLRLKLTLFQSTNCLLRKKRRKKTMMKLVMRNITRAWGREWKTLVRIQSHKQNQPMKRRMVTRPKGHILGLINPPISRKTSPSNRQAVAPIGELLVVALATGGHHLASRLTNTTEDLRVTVPLQRLNTHISDLKILALTDQQRRVDSNMQEATRSHINTNQRKMALTVVASLTPILNPHMKELGLAMAIWNMKR